MAQRCSFCGKVNSDKVGYCRSCNHRLIDANSRQDALDFSIFTARDREIKVLQQQLEVSIAGHGKMVMLVGEAGIGKTFLASEFASRASKRGVKVLRGCAFEGDWQPPYSLWVEAFSGYAQSVSSERLRPHLGAAAPALARLVPAIQRAWPAIPLPPLLSLHKERIRLHDAVIQFLLSLGRESPVLLVLDDLHWADVESLRLLHYLSRFAAGLPLLVIGTHRLEEQNSKQSVQLSDILAAIQHETGYTQITLRNLSYQETEQYLSRVVKYSLPRPLVQAIHKSTGGNPLYNREVLKHLLEEGKILLRGGQWSSDFSLADLGIPQGIRELVRHRLSRLSRKTAAMLKIVSGFSGGFEFSILQELVGVPEDALLTLLDQAIAAGFIQVIDSRSHVYQFVHTIVRDALYESLNPDRKVRLHRDIALAIEKACGGHEPDSAAELAWQYYQSQGLADPVKGAHYSLLAAGEAQRAHSPERSAVFLRMAYELSPIDQPAARAEILCKLAMAETEALLLEKAQDSAKEALDLMRDTHAELQIQAEFLVTIASRLKEDGASPTFWEPLIEKGISLLGGKRDINWARLKLLQDRYEYISCGEIKTARWLGYDAEAMAIARGSGKEEDYLATLHPFAWRALQETEKLRSWTQGLQQPQLKMKALDIIARDLIEHHFAPREAVAILEELLQLAEDSGAIPEQADALIHLAGMHAVLGEFALSRQSVEQAHARVERLGPAHRLHLFEQGVEVVTAYYLDQNWPRLAEIVTQALANSRQANPLNTLVAAYATLVYTRAGNRENRVRQLLTSLSGITESAEPTTYTQNPVINVTGCAIWEMQAVEFAGVFRNQAQEQIEAGISGGLLVPTELIAARLAALQRDDDAASHYFALSREKSIADHVPHLQAITDYDEALALTRAGSPDRDRILELINSSRRIFLGKGMSGWAGRTAALRKRVEPPAHPRYSRTEYPAGLTVREVEVLRLIASGRTNMETADELIISLRTVERHITNIYNKINARRRADATAFAIKNKLINDSL